MPMSHKARFSGGALFDLNKFCRGELAAVPFTKGALAVGVIGETEPPEPESMEGGLEDSAVFPDGTASAGEAFDLAEREGEARSEGASGVVNA